MKNNVAVITIAIPILAPCFLWGGNPRADKLLSIPRINIVNDIAHNVARIEQIRQSMVSVIWINSKSSGNVLTTNATALALKVTAARIDPRGPVEP